MENTETTLQTELDFYRQNQVIVEQEIKSLIADNQKLSQQVAILLKEKLQYAQEMQNNDYVKNFEESAKQISLLAKERDSLHVLWQTSQKTIEALEIELKTYQNYNGRINQSTNEENRDLELKLETAVSDYVELETKYKQLLSERNALEVDLRNRVKEIDEHKEKDKTTAEEMAKLKEALDKCKIDLSVELKRHDDLKSQLLLSQKESLDKGKKEAEAKAKVAEALQLFDLVSCQKHEAYKKIAELTEELTKVKSIMANVKNDIETNCRAELELTKQSYNEKVSDMLQHIHNLDAELVEKGLLLNRALRENKILQTANENHLQQERDNFKLVDPKLAIAEQKLEAAFQELILSERRNIQLVCEKQTLALDLQRTQDIHTRECKRRDWEESLLKEQIQELKLQVEHLQKSLEETHAMVSKLQTMLSSRTELSQKMVSTKEGEVLELSKHLQNQMELNKKWKESYVDMTEKLKQKLEALYKENKELRTQLSMPHLSSSKDNSSNSL